jgi:hypothetical protein
MWAKEKEKLDKSVFIFGSVDLSNFVDHRFRKFYFHPFFGLLALKSRNFIYCLFISVTSKCTCGVKKAGTRIVGGTPTAVSEERDRKEREGKERKGKERKGKERKGKERKGKERRRERQNSKSMIFESPGLARPPGQAPPLGLQRGALPPGPACLPGSPRPSPWRPAPPPGTPRPASLQVLQGRFHLQDQLLYLHGLQGRLLTRLTPSPGPPPPFPDGPGPAPPYLKYCMR